ncbi:AbrB/MazE/SpoVT family DNA-binding domain-containing protein [Rhizobium sp. EC-SD404]|jgi:putative addiction module antidote|uniref:AbrB/MazE/SpoVT family DNA-binding domain-containing protein n=1 Tax=Rhizobium sp. EC-SD404 TaxID=2038389 RepID=UPI00125BEE64|nr:AbrB/MazE/SpoVT family DNA-binding domain-containing protein [Rhizobium sp. EC-SD404]VVT13768.1 AbrB family transcriptional regulator [Rhizobium sp. EC-SD404]
MNVQVRRIGNSEGIILPKEVLERHGLKSGDTLELREENGGLKLVPQPSAEEFARRMEIAKQRMKKYEVALRELAK